MIDREEITKRSAILGRDPNSRRLIVLLAIVALITMITAAIAGYLLWTEKQNQANAGKNLAIQVQDACKNPRTRVQLGSVCVQAKKVEQKIASGPQGPPGLQGPEGRPGLQGPPGIQGPIGVTGATGRNGQDGKDGATGPTGPVGPEGAKGDTGPAGSAGKDGKDGADGAPGANAYPFTFSFQANNGLGGTTWTCTITDPAVPADCTSE